MAEPRSTPVEESSANDEPFHLTPTASPPAENPFPDRSNFKRRGAVFSSNGLGLESFDPVVATLNYLPSASTTINVLQAIIRLSDQDPEGFTDMSTLQSEVGLGRSSVLRAVNRLYDLAAISIIDGVWLNGTRARQGYVLVAADQTPVLEANDERREHFRPQWEEVMALPPTILDRPKVRGDQLSVFTFFSALARSHYDKTGRREIHIGNLCATLEIHTTTGRPPGVLDLRYLLAITSMWEAHRRVYGPKQTFVVRFRDLLQLMGRPYEGAYRDRALDGLSRWSDTQFEMTSVPDKISRFYGDSLVINDRFTLFSRFTTLFEKGRNGSLVPVAVRISLDDSFFQRLQSPQFSLVVHPEILREQSPRPFDHCMYYWSRRAVKRSEHSFWAYDHIHREVCPSLSRGDFRNSVREFLERHWNEDLGEAHYAGYCYGPQEEGLAIKAHPDDELVGLLSAGNVLHSDSTDLEDRKPS